MRHIKLTRFHKSFVADAVAVAESLGAVPSFGCASGSAGRCTWADVCVQAVERVLGPWLWELISVRATDGGLGLG